jgi:hypothetical protein
MPTFDFKTALSISFGPVAVLAYSKLDIARKVQASEGYSSLGIKEYNNEIENYQGVPMFLPCYLDGWLLPIEPILDITGGKTIVKTQIDSQDGTFKEMFSKNDYAITIRGILSSQDGTDNYPKDLVRRLRRICESTSNIPISCSLTTLFGIDRIVIESYSLPAVEGFQSLQPYQLNCFSDKDIVLELNSQP